MMGAEVVVVITDVGLQAFKKHSTANRCLFDMADTIVAKPHLELYHWVNMNYNTQMELDSELARICNDYDFSILRATDHPGDYAVWGSLDSKIFNLKVRQVVDFDGKDEKRTEKQISSEVLKVRNSHPDSKKCFQCGGILKEPTPGIKYCQKCEG